MLVYNHDKELIGIDKESLTLLGYDNFQTLIKEHGDVAEMFVKKPGYIHNFTNFPWIDFVLHAESEDAKVIIAGKSKAFSASIDISTMFLKSAPEEEAFIVRLKNIHNYQLDASERPEPAPEPFTPSTQEFNAPAHDQSEAPTPPPVTPIPEIEEPEPIVFDHQDMFVDEEPSGIQTPSTLHTPEVDDDMEIFFQDEEPEPEEQRIEANPEIPDVPESIFDNIVEDEQEAAPMLGSYLSEKDKEYLADLEFTDDYVYNPQIAADELGLPVDLIEEFIGDFIKQAHEFKEQLFTAMKEEDFDNIKILSHKLKGVAANLRIEDAFEVLRTINETSDIEECEANLKRFYMTIGKLEGKDIQEVQQELDAKTDEELYDLTPKFEAPAEEIPVAEEMPAQDEMIIDPLVDEHEESMIELPDFEEPSIVVDETPIDLDEAVHEEVEEAPSEKEDDDALYDFGLLTDNSDDPMIVLEDEEEIINDLNNFDLELDDEPLSEIKDLDEIESDALDNAPVLNFSIDTAANEIGLSADLVGALIEDYIEEANEMKEKLTDVIEGNDVMRWKGYAIQLKGVSDNLRIHEISDALQHLIDSTETNQAKAAMQEFYGFINQL